MGAGLSRLGRLAFAAVTMFGLVCAPALAQEGDSKKVFREPGINFRDPEKPYIQWLAGSLIVLACLLVAFKNPHRTHLD